MTKDRRQLAFSLLQTASLSQKNDTGRPAGSIDSPVTMHQNRSFCGVDGPKKSENSRPRRWFIHVERHGHMGDAPLLADGSFVSVPRSATPSTPEIENGPDAEVIDRRFQVPCRELRGPENTFRNDNPDPREIQHENCPDRQGTQNQETDPKGDSMTNSQ